ncbi:MAG: hypothetical protein J5736_03615, partial [Bacilli bacterium]|nr:hypothetical protein [Bacilli bacterium]
MKLNLIGALLALPLAIGMGVGGIGSSQPLQRVNALDLSETEKDIIASSSASDFFHREKTEEQGTWTINQDSVSVDAFGTAYALEGANLLSKKGNALGAYEFRVHIQVSEVNPGIENPMIGFVPWFQDENNYLFVQLKFSSAAQFQTTDAEKAEGYGLEQLIFSGKYDGEAKYITMTGQEENTVIPAGGASPSSELVSAKRSLKNAN